MYRYKYKYAVVLVPTAKGIHDNRNLRGMIVSRHRDRADAEEALVAEIVGDDKIPEQYTYEIVENINHG